MKKWLPQVALHTWPWRICKITILVRVNMPQVRKTYRQQWRSRKERVSKCSTHLHHRIQNCKTVGSLNDQSHHPQSMMINSRVDQVDLFTRSKFLQSSHLWSEIKIAIVIRSEHSIFYLHLMLIKVMLHEKTITFGHSYSHTNFKKLKIRFLINSFLTW